MNEVNSALGTFSCCRTNLLHPAHDSISSPVTTLDLFPQTAFRCSKKDLKYTRKIEMHPSLVWSTNDHIVNWGSFKKVGCGCSPNRFCWPEQNKSVFLGLNTHLLLLASKLPRPIGQKYVVTLAENQMFSPSSRQTAYIFQCTKYMKNPNTSCN